MFVLKSTENTCIIITTDKRAPGVANGISTNILARGLHQPLIVCTPQACVFAPSSSYAVRRFCLHCRRTLRGQNDIVFEFWSASSFGLPLNISRFASCADIMLCSHPPERQPARVTTHARACVNEYCVPTVITTRTRIIIRGYHACFVYPAHNVRAHSEAWWRLKNSIKSQDKKKNSVFPTGVYHLHVEPVDG